MSERKETDLTSKLLGNNVWIYLCVILLFAALSFFFGNVYVALAEIIVFIGLLVFDVIRNAKKRKEIIDYMQNLTYHADTAAKDSLLHFPMPITILRIDGSITWYNKSFRELFAKNEHLFESHIQDLVTDINWFELIKQTEGISEDITLGDRKYQMLGNVVKTQKKGEKDSYLVLLYWVDKTELYQLKEQVKDDRTDVAVIMVDNYDEIAANMDDMARAQILSQIDKSLKNWLDGVGGILKKVDRDRYIYIFADKYVQKFEENKFSILEEVRNISTSFEMKAPFTMSIGIGVGGASLEENENYAKKSLDMAMGRGGDQAVIKNGDNFKYFGGKFNEYEKNTRVKTKMIAQALRELIHSSDRVFIMGHTGPDMDSFGACMGIFRACANLNKTAYIVCDPSNNKEVRASMDNFRKNSAYASVFITEEQALELADPKMLLVVVDVHRPSITQSPKLLGKAKNVIVIDHHRRGEEFIENAALIYHEPYASSTSEMVAELLQYIGGNVKLTKAEAEALYAGIVVDTKNFSFKTGVRTFEAASFLKKYGVDTIAIKRLFRTSMEEYLQKMKIVGAAEVVFGNMAISSCNLEEFPKSERSIVIAQAADELLDIEGIGASFVLGYAEEIVTVSARSLDEINVQLIMEKLGGGGHRMVAGCQLRGVSLAEAKDKLTDVLEEYVKELKQ